MRTSNCPHLALLSILLLLPFAATPAGAASPGSHAQRRFATTGAEVSQTDAQKNESELARLKGEVQKLSEAHERNSRQYEESLTAFVYLSTHVTNPPKYAYFVGPAARAVEESRVALEIARASIKLLEEKAGESGTPARSADVSAGSSKGRPSHGERETGMDLHEPSDF